jgi:hypothetical protein
MLTSWTPMAARPEEQGIRGLPMRRIVASTAMLAGAAFAQPPAEVAVYGRVVDVLGNGLPAAEVRVTVDSATVGRTLADGEGVFQLRKLPSDSPLVLRARVAGKIDCAIAVPAGGPARAVIAMLEDAAPLRGSVTCGGAPAAGAHLAAFAFHPLGPPFDWHAEAVADDQGRFELQAPLRQCVVRAFVPGHGVGEITAPRDGAPCLLALAPLDGGPRRVRVNGLAAGTPATITVAVREQRRPDARMLPAPLRSVAVYSDGTAELWPLPFPHEVMLTARGNACEPVIIPCKARETRDLEFTARPLPADLVAPRTIVTGQLVDPLGRGLPAVRVLPVVEGRALPGTATDADGRFELAVPVRERVQCALALERGSWRLADPAAELALDGLTVTTLFADSKTPLRLHAQRSGSIRGVAKGPGGVPLGGAEVDLFTVPEAGGRRGALRSATDAAGRIDITGLPPGSFTVEVRSAAGVGAAKVEVEAGGTADLGALEFMTAGDLVGVVRDADGRPAGGEVIVAEQLTRAVKPGLPHRRLWSAPVLTDRDGRFRLQHLPEGRWRVYVDSNQHVGRTRSRVLDVEVRAGAESTVELDVER